MGSTVHRSSVEEHGMEVLPLAKPLFLLSLSKFSLSNRHPPEGRRCEECGGRHRQNWRKPNPAEALVDLPKAMF